ncbi:MAG: helix-turn-helix domain-containing protein [Planctomycetota bacterium]
MTRFSFELIIRSGIQRTFIPEPIVRMANYLSLEEAAAKLGIPAERLIDLRSQGQVRGFRDGASWKFPDTEVDRLGEELQDLAAGGSGFGSGILYDDQSGGSSIGSKVGSVIGGDEKASAEGSDLDIGGDGPKPESGSGSDVNLMLAADDSQGSDVALVAAPKGDSGPEILDMDSADLEIKSPAVDHDSADLGMDDSELKLQPVSGSTPEDAKAGTGSSVIGLDLEEDSNEAVIGSDSALDILDSDVAGLSGGASSLELMSELDAAADKAASDSGADVLSELDLLSAEQTGSGLISGIGSGLVTGSDVGSSPSGPSSDIDDALADDDLVIADDDDDLVIDSAGSDISVAGDSGINLMSPSDSGLSLESEPLDLAGSSISALDLGTELGSGVASGVDDASGSAVDFQADEEFQLSPSGIGLETDEDSGSQVIEVEDSEVAESVDFAGSGFGGDEFGGDEAFAEDAGAVADGAFGDDGGMALDTDEAMVPAATAAASPEIPFDVWQVSVLAGLLCILALCGMISTDLVRNMWAYAEPAAPVSGLTESLISMFGMDP